MSLVRLWASPNCERRNKNNRIVEEKKREGEGMEGEGNKKREKDIIGKDQELRERARKKKENR